MSTLYLVRHGQATLHGDDYDALSPRGREQARALGRAWAARGITLDALYVGPRLRHRETADEMRAGAAESGAALPTPELQQGFDEVDVGRLVGEALRRVLPACPDLTEQLARGKLDDAGRAAFGHLGGVLQRLLERWAAGDPDHADLEPFDSFVRRAGSALRDVMTAQGRSRRFAVVTSAGPVAVALKVALGLVPEKAMALMAATLNASITELRYTENRITMVGFNDVGHLADAMRTRI